MEIGDKKYFMKYNDTIGRSLRSKTADFVETFDKIEDEDAFRELSYYLWAVEKKEPDVDEIYRSMCTYQIAFQKELNEINFHEAMHYLSEILTGPNKKTPCVSYRRVPVSIFNERGRRIYRAPGPEYLNALMTALFQQIQSLIQKELSLSEIFYHASLIHLRVFWIHPFVKNNIKAAILMEKWFLAEKLGKIYLKLPSEKYYFENRAVYDTNTLLGSAYNTIDDSRCLPFLLMLPEALKIKDIQTKKE
ncbi:MAG: Fic family protein [Methanimicrococcus sp.]|nr:Fic family protein [Methanimicrococcus sp.]